jgi:hypothetical protein
MSKKSVAAKIDRLILQIQKDEKLLEELTPTKKQLTADLDRLAKTVRVDLGILPKDVAALMKEAEISGMAIDESQKLLEDPRYKISKAEKDEAGARILKFVATNLRLQREHMERQMKALRKLVDYLKTQEN